MYVTSETIRLMVKNHQGGFSGDELAALNNYKKHSRQGHQVHSLVGEGGGSAGARAGHHGGLEADCGHGGREDRQGAPDLWRRALRPKLVAMATIFAADTLGLPVSTTHVLSSGVAGTMAANKSGLQWSTVKSIAAGVGVHAAGGGLTFRAAVCAVPHNDGRRLRRNLMGASAAADALCLCFPSTSPTAAAPGPETSGTIIEVPFAE